MKKLHVILIMGLAVALGSTSFKLKKLKILTPPGTVWLQGFTFIDEAEVANTNWLEYLQYLKKDSTHQSYLNALPDTVLVNKWYNNAMAKTDTNAGKYKILRYPGFMYFPLVGITHQQAVDYCQWRSQVVNENIRTEKAYKKHFTEKGLEVTITYRLPTQAEWQLAATAGLNPDKYPWGSKALYLAQGADTNTMKPKHKARYYKALNLVVNPNAASAPSNISAWKMVYRGSPNHLGLFCIYGNVAEMVAEKGIAKGGSFLTPKDEVTPHWKKAYTGPQYWLGFRCVADLAINRIPGRQSLAKVGYQHQISPVVPHSTVFKATLVQKARR